MDSLSVIIGGLLALAGSFGTALINRESEERKKEYEIKHTKLAIVFENQKIAFKNLIQAMFKAESVIMQPYDQSWEPVSDKVYYDFIKALNEDALFLDSVSERALRFFGTIINETIYFEHPPPSDQEIRNAYEQLKYLSDCIRRYFRKLVGVSKDEANLNFDLDLLFACRFIYSTDFDEAGAPKFEIIELTGMRSPVDIIDNAKENIASFREDFNRFIEYLKTNPQGSRSYLSKVETAQKYYDSIFKSGKWGRG